MGVFVPFEASSLPSGPEEAQASFPSLLVSVNLQI